MFSTLHRIWHSSLTRPVTIKNNRVKRRSHAHGSTHRRSSKHNDFNYTRECGERERESKRDTFSINNLRAVQEETVRSAADARMVNDYFCCQRFYDGFRGIRLFCWQNSILQWASASLRPGTLFSQFKSVANLLGRDTFMFRSLSFSRDASPSGPSPTPTLHKFESSIFAVVNMGGKVC